MAGNVIVIDDNQSILRIVGHWLEKEGYEVCLSNNPIEGLRLLEEGSFDLLLLDLRMREMNGFELLERLRANEALRNLPVILITGGSEMRKISQEKRDLFETGLEKPFERDELLQRVSETLAYVHSPG